MLFRVLLESRDITDAHETAPAEDGDAATAATD
jgi:hypothetical protein